VEEEVEATDAGRGGMEGLVKGRAGRDLGSGRGLGVALPGEVDEEEKRVFTGLALRIVERPADCRTGRPTGVTKLFEAPFAADRAIVDAPVPEIVLARGCVDVAAVVFVAATFSAF
jgi:hypothetical protein